MNFGSRCYGPVTTPTIINCSLIQCLPRYCEGTIQHRQNTSNSTTKTRPTDTNANAIMANNSIHLCATDAYNFVLPGYEPNILINVLGKPILAHSVILKVRSVFFRRSMGMASAKQEGQKYKVRLTTSHLYLSSTK